MMKKTQPCGWVFFSVWALRTFITLNYLRKKYNFTLRRWCVASFIVNKINRQSVQSRVNTKQFPRPFNPVRKQLLLFVTIFTDSSKLRANLCCRVNETTHHATEYIRIFVLNPFRCMSQGSSPKETRSQFQIPMYFYGRVQQRPKCKADVAGALWATNFVGTLYRLALE